MPVLYDDLADIAEAYSVLSASRPTGFSGPLPIPLSEVAAYIELYEVADRERFVRLVRALDDAYLAEHYRKHARAEAVGERRRAA